MTGPTREHAEAQVGVFIDFENLIYGLIERYGEQGAYEHFQAQRILDTAAARGRVRWARAYADWRVRSLNRFQGELYARGVELIHVLGRGNKNAVDVKMAIDMVEMSLTQPDVGTLLICSGDRDFLPALTALKRHGRRLVALAPQRAMSAECRRLCDEALPYEDLLRDPLSEPAERPEGDLDRLRAEVLSVVRAYHPRPVSGAQLKQHLTQSYGGRFEERAFGFVKLGDLLGLFEETLEVRRPEQGDLELTLRAPRPTEEAPAAGAARPLDPSDPARELAPYEDHALQAALSALKGYQYTLDAPARRRVIRELFTHLSAPEGARWHELMPTLCDRMDLSRSQANKYHAILLQSQAFRQLDPAEESPVKQRRMGLAEGLESAEGLIERYEQSVLLKVCAQHPALDAALSARLLGLSARDPQHLAYAERLLARAQREVALDPALNTQGEPDEPAP